MVSLARRAAAEAVGTAFLVAAVIGSGIAASRLSPNDVGLQLLENSLITGAALIALILALQPVSAAFNPIVTLLERAFGALSNAAAAGLIAAQLTGGILGAVVANLMFGDAAVSISTHQRSGGGVWLGEVVATLGLMLVIFGTLRSGRADRVAYAVGGYITAAYWFTSSTSFANPAVTVARMFSDSFAGIAPSSVTMFVLMQVLGGALGFLLIRFLWPASNRFTMQINDHRPSVLFLCVHNAGRSQMAMGFFTHLAGDAAVAWSGGSEPADQISPAAVEVMRERGIDISTAQPKRWTDEVVRAADVVVSMGCGDACPVLPGKRYEEWTLDDPAGLEVAAVRPVRDEIERRVRGLLRELQVPVADRQT